MSRKSDEKMPRKKTEPPSKSVRIHEDLYDGIMVLSAIFKKSAPQFTSEILRPIIEAALASHGMEYPIKAKDAQLSDTIQQVIAKLKTSKN
jgi:hypothetical protein